MRRRRASLQNTNPGQAQTKPCPPHARLALAIFYQVFPPKVLLSFPGRSLVSVFDELHMSKTNNGGCGRGGLLFVILP